MSQDWASYFTNVNGKLASIRLDLGVRAGVPDRDRPWLLWIWVYFNHPRQDGLSSDEESKRLWSLEDALTAALQNATNSAFVGCITTEGRREFYFYAKTPKGLKETASQCIGLSHGYEFWCEAKEDPKWAQYLDVLYPSEEQRELIENRRLMDLMKQRGDKLEGTRDMRHWCNFKDSACRDDFRRAVQALGYKAESEYQNEKPDTEFAYVICIVKMQEMTRRAVDDAVIQLFRTCKVARGDYTGWECELITDAPSETIGRGEKPDDRTAP